MFMIVKLIRVLFVKKPQILKNLSAGLRLYSFAISPCLRFILRTMIFILSRRLTMRI
ncbi:hypothetical protein [Microvirus sp.]|nr:hypothetical protein [Microvirus sp.]UYL88457.1 hypothetical protein [Microvirus sp.]UYL88483.1 hypothetical protein [Microvirus sp.]